MRPHQFWNSGRRLPMFAIIAFWKSWRSTLAAVFAYQSHMSRQAECQRPPSPALRAVSSRRTAKDELKKFPNSVDPGPSIS